MPFEHKSHLSHDIDKDNHAEWRARVTDFVPECDTNGIIGSNRQKPKDFSQTPHFHTAPQWQIHVPNRQGMVAATGQSKTGKLVSSESQTQIVLQ